MNDGILFYDKNCKNKIAAGWTSLYCIFMFCVFPLYFDNSYINILEAKTHFFVFLTAVYLIGLLLIVFFDFILKNIKGNKKKVSDENRKSIKIHIYITDIFAMIFLIAVVVSTLLSENKKAAFWGTEGKLFGTLILLMCLFVYYGLSRYFKENTFIFWGMLIGPGLVGILTVLNRFKIDPLNMYENIDPTQIKDYLSTMGQINIISGYFCIFTALLMGLYLYSKKKLSKLLYGFGVLITIAAGICSNSDSYLATLLIIFLCYLYLSMDSFQKIKEYLILFFGAACVMEGLHLWNQNVQDSIEWGMLQRWWIEDIPWIFVGIILLAVIIVFIKVISDKKSITKKESIKLETVSLKKCRKIYLCIIGLCLIFGAVLILFVNLTDTSLENTKFNWIVFNDAWGTNRGYVWKRTGILFMKLPLIKKIFGVGPGGFEAFFDEYFLDSISRFGYYFQDAHNEFLQFMVTTGIVGLIGYVGMFISSIISCLKQGSDMKKVLAAVFIAGFIQGMVNNPLVFITPYIFLFMGMVQSNSEL